MSPWPLKQAGDLRPLCGGDSLLAEPIPGSLHPPGLLQQQASRDRGSPSIVPRLCGRRFVGGESVVKPLSLERECAFGLPMPGTGIEQQDGFVAGVRIEHTEHGAPGLVREMKVAVPGEDLDERFRRHGYVSDIFVEASARRIGVGAAVLQAIEAPLRICSKAFNTAAIQSYVSLGFRSGCSWPSATDATVPQVVGYRRYFKHRA